MTMFVIGYSFEHFMRVEASGVRGAASHSHLDNGWTNPIWLHWASHAPWAWRRTCATEHGGSSVGPRVGAAGGLLYI